MSILTRAREQYRAGDAFPDVGYVRQMTGRDLIYPAPEIAPEEPTRSPVVGLIGKKRAGKDTFARGLVEKGFRRFAFADPLKAAALDVDPLILFERDERYLAALDFFDAPVERLSSVVDRVGWEQAKEIREVRRFLQNFGVGIRALDEDFWVRPLSGFVAADQAPVVVTDVRFPNEVREVASLGGVIVRIVRPGLESTDTHESENALNGYPADIDVLNNRFEEDLVEIARELATSL